MPTSEETELNPQAYAVRGRLAGLFERFPRIEGGLVALLAFAYTLWAERSILFDDHTYQTDARLHEYWMRRFQDSELFQDPLTEGFLATGYVPYGFRGLYWLVSHVLDPVQAAELMPLVLVPVSAWLLFRIVRLHADWLPAAWLGVFLFLAPLDIQRFSGGHQRAFFHPTVLLTVYLLLRRKPAFAALVPPLGALFYPSAALVGVVILVVSALSLERRWRFDPGRIAWAGASTALAAAAVLVPARLAGYSPEIIARAEAMAYPDFGAGSRVHYFGVSHLEYLSQNLSGFNLRWSGSILVCAALLLLLVRPTNARLLRLEVWAMGIATLALFALAQALLFHLYLPHRYTYALIPFCAILIAVAWRPTWQSLAARFPHGRLLAVAGAAVALALAVFALIAFPLGLRVPLDETWDVLRERAWYFVTAVVLGLALALLLARRRGAWAAAAVATATVLLGSVAAAASDYDDGVRCRNEPLLTYLGTLPKDAIVAGNPPGLDCVPIVSRRAVVVNAKLFQVWEKAYWQMSRERTFDSIDAVYGTDPAAVLALRDRYGADFLVVERRARFKGWERGAPFTPLVRRLLRTVETRAVDRLPQECVTWSSDRFQVFDLACVSEAAGRR